MGAVKRVAVAGVLLVLAGLASCGDSESPGAPKKSNYFRWTETRPPLVPPEARNGAPDDWNHRLARRLVINLIADGTVYIKTYEFRLTKDARERDDAILAMVDALESIRQQATEDDGPPLKALELHFDRGITWRDAADCVRAARTAKVPIDWLQIAVRASGADGDHTLDLTLHSTETQAGQGFQIHLRRTRDRTTAVQIGGRSWAFPAGDELETAAFVAEANRQWARIEKEVRARRKPAVAEITVGDNVRWVYVVTLLDILRGSVHSTFTFPADGFALTVRAALPEK